MSLNPRLAGYRDARLMSFYEQAVERMKSVPGVDSVSLSMYPPISDQMGSWTQSIQVDDRPFINTGSNSVFFNTISPGYFATIGQTLLRGRDFGPQDSETSVRTCIITGSLARDFFPDQEPLGRRISIGRGAKRQNLEVVGIVKDAKYRLLQEPARRIGYLPHRQSIDVLNNSNLMAEVRTSLPLSAVAEQVRRQLRDIDASVLVRVESLNERIQDSLVTERVFATLSMFLGVVALCLAVAGLYGLLGYIVARRTAEIGLRLALGANRKDVLWMVLRQSLVLSLAGLIVGILASVALGRFAEKLVYGVTARDPLGLGLAVFVVLALAFAASYVPARRAMRVDPMTALRYE